MKVWEYNTFVDPVGGIRTILDMLDEMGKQGWELAALTTNLPLPNCTAVFKREVSPPENPPPPKRQKRVPEGPTGGFSA